MLKGLSGPLIMADLSVSGRTFGCPVGLFGVCLSALCSVLMNSLLFRRGSRFAAIGVRVFFPLCCWSKS